MILILYQGTGYAVMQDVQSILEKLYIVYSLELFVAILKPRFNLGTKFGLFMASLSMVNELISYGVRPLTASCDRILPNMAANLQETET